jgi:hypothetical protein
MEPVRKNGTFHELNNNGVPRSQSVNENKEKLKWNINSLTIPELKLKATQYGLSILNPISGKILIKKDIIDLIRLKFEAEKKAHLEEIAKTKGKEGSTKQLVLTDFQQYERELEDMAHTGDKFWEANKGSGDYHHNFDTVMFFKIMKAFELTYPDMCRDLHNEWLAGKIPNSLHGFIDENGRPTRSVEMFLDNAPYHHGAVVQLNNVTKKECANILRLKNVSTINFKE